jgi:hypothetical protein
MTEKNFRTRVVVKAKVCACCGERKSSDDFYKSKVHRSGLSSYCKQCSRVSARESDRKTRMMGEWLTSKQRVAQREKYAAIAREAYPAA